MKFIVDARNDCFDEGGSAEFYDLLYHPKYGFKQFRNKSSAVTAWKKQKLLSRFNLAPKIITKICRLPIIICDNDSLGVKTNWGFVTEKARLVDEKIMSKRMGQIQKLVESIHSKTGLKFWDCHYYNVGYIRRNSKAKLVCIDTGSESFMRDCNAWGFDFPGPKCNYCKKYQCSCCDY